MKVIQKKISLEQFKSRMPSIIPAYAENGQQHNFTHLMDLLNEPMVNYGMLPFDVKVDENSNLGKYSGKLYSYPSLVEIFHKLDNYYNKPLVLTCQEEINVSTEDQNFYKWLLDKCFPFFVFDIELKNKNVNIQDIKGYWGTNRLSIKEVGVWAKKMTLLSGSTDCCDRKEYESRGGDAMEEKLNEWYDNHINVIVCKHQDYGHDFIYEVQETDKNITVKTVKYNNNRKTYEVILHSYQIYEPRVRILGNNRYIRYGHLDSNNNVINPQNIEIIDGILTIPCLFSSDANVLVVSEPFFNIPLLLTNNMENIGEMSSICEEWEDGYEYNQNIVNQDNIDYSGGPMVYYNGDNWILKSYLYPGYIYSEPFKEVYFGTVGGMTDAEYEYFNDNELSFQNNHLSTPQWERYFDYLPKINDITLNTYAYKDTQLIFNPNPYVMGEKKLIETNDNKGYYLYKENLYPIINCDSVLIQDKYYEVFYVYQNGDVKRNPYIYFNGQQVFINKPVCAPNSGLQYDIINNGTYIRYHNTLKTVVNSDTYDGYTYHMGKNILFKKITIGGSTIMSAQTEGIGSYVSENILKEQQQNFHGYTTFTKDNDWYVIFSTPYETYNGDVVKGETTSKLNTINHKLKMATDNLGNTFNGLMPYKTFTYENGTYSTYVVNPQPNDWLSLPYIPKYTSHLDEIENNIFWGNMIEKLTFHYDIDITHPTTGTTVRDSNIISSKSSYTENIKHLYNSHSGNNIVEMKDVSYHFVQVCENLDELREMENVLKENYPYCKNITCDIEYYMGTIIEKNNTTYNLKLKSNSDYYGVKYTETFNLEKKQCLYYFDEMDFCILNYWEMNPTLKEYDNNAYNIKGLVEPTASFEFKTQPFELHYGCKLYNNYNNIIFYKVNELSETVEYKGVEYPIEVDGNEKYFSYPIILDEILRKEYKYYVIENGTKVYANLMKNGDIDFMELTINGITFQTASLQNRFSDDEYGLLSNEVYCHIPIKLYLRTQQNTSDSYFDWKNDMSVAPLIFNENKLGQATQEKLSGNIYIDRGTVRAIDYHLRLLEAKSLESLEQIGNGFFKFNSNNGIK